MSDVVAILFGAFLSALVIALILVSVRVAWLIGLWREDRRREKEYADAWVRTHRNRGDR